jgi:hypothetical protein
MKARDHQRIVKEIVARYERILTTVAAERDFYRQQAEQSAQDHREAVEELAAEVHRPR